MRLGQMRRYVDHMVCYMVMCASQARDVFVSQCPIPASRSRVVCEELMLSNWTEGMEGSLLTD